MLYRHTDQHYDDVLGHGLAESDLEPHIGVDMRIRSDLSTKTADPITRTKTLRITSKRSSPTPPFSPSFTATRTPASFRRRGPSLPISSWPTTKRGSGV